MRLKGPKERVLVIAPHPDDEVLGTGGLIATALAEGSEVKVLYLTHGGLILNGHVRKAEALEAMQLLGLKPESLVFLGYPDFFIRFYKAENVLKDFKNVLLGYRPTMVFVTAPFDLNADHRAAHLFLKRAISELECQWAPRGIYGYLVHARGWPSPRKFLPSEALKPPAKSLSWTAFPLASDVIPLKHKALLKYKSQIAYCRDFLESFVRANELFFEL